MCARACRGDNSGRELELLDVIAHNQTTEQETHEADIWPQSLLSRPFSTDKHTIKELLIDINEICTSSSCNVMPMFIVLLYVVLFCHV